MPRTRVSRSRSGRRYGGRKNTRADTLCTSRDTPMVELFKNSEIGSDSGDAKVLYVAISSDRGLCGGIHSSVTKATLRALNKNPEARVAVLGDKPKAQLARSRTDDFVITFNQIGRDIPTFAEAAAIADEIKTKGGDWDVVKIIYNKYISAISYEPTELVVTNAKSLNDAAGFKAYEQEEDSTGDIAEFSLANALYLALVEGHAAEQSARRTAMDNGESGRVAGGVIKVGRSADVLSFGFVFWVTASGSESRSARSSSSGRALDADSSFRFVDAADMIGKLNLQYNRARQGKITGELVRPDTAFSPRTRNESRWLTYTSNVCCFSLHSTIFTLTDRDHHRESYFPCLASLYRDRPC